MSAKAPNAIINGKIKSLTRSGSNKRDVAADAAALIVRHGLVHGDVSAAGRLLTAAPNLVVLFFRAFGIAISSKEGGFSASLNKLWLQLI